MATTLLTVTNNTAPPIELTIQRKNGNTVETVNLSDVDTAELVIQNQATGENTTSGYQEATITDAPNGEITYTPLSTDFPEQGTYIADVRLTYSDGGIEILYEQQKFKVRNKIAVA